MGEMKRDEMQVEMLNTAHKERQTMEREMEQLVQKVSQSTENLLDDIRKTSTHDGPTPLVPFEPKMQGGKAVHSCCGPRREDAVEELSRKLDEGFAALGQELAQKTRQQDVMTRTGTGGLRMSKRISARDAV